MDHRFRSWQLLYGGEETERQYSPNDQLPREGALADKIEALAGDHPLLPQLKCQVTESYYHVQGPVGTPILLVFQRWTFFHPFTGKGGGSKILLHVSSAEDPVEASYLKTFLRDLCGLKVVEFDPLVQGLDKLGYTLPGATVPEELIVRANDTIIEAGSKIMAVRGYKMRANTPGVLLDLGPDYLHDLRVATRRGRFALRILKPFIDAKVEKDLRDDLTWIAGEAGAVRDIDVFLLQLEPYFDQLGVSPGAKQTILGPYRTRRALALRNLGRVLKSARYERVLQTLESMEGKFHRFNRSIDTRELASKNVAKAVNRISRWLDRSESDLTEKDLHAIRIDFKGLRYTCEFFMDFFENEMKKLIRLLVSFQDTLGLHNDALTFIAGLKELRRNLEESGEATEEVLSAIDALSSILKKVAEKQREEFVKIWRGFPKKLAVMRKML